ncbi:hypothetical protein [Arsukibacterium perlucidum]|uniref:hypothetical protein n=1 Tax=Arsukibacterium perlucidum TaxID=368811 RepID=UPI00036AE381|nr:hypothetical protein [Arsukibacterium perlucidum]
MLVPDLIIRQNFQTTERTMNAQAMLADFLSFLIPKCMHKARVSALSATAQSQRK